MTKEELASSLNGTRWEEIPFELTENAKESNLVIVYGISDDLMEIEGAITDEGGCYGGSDFLIDINGLLCDRDDIEDDDVLDGWLKRSKSAKKISAVWTPNGYPTWSYRTSIPHASFDVIEDGDVFCRGIVFELASL